MARRRKEPNPKTCPKCPHRYEARGCPAWIEADSGFMETNMITQEQRIVTGCFYQVIPKLMAHVVAAANRPAAQLADWRNQMIKGFQAVVARMPPPERPKTLEIDHAPEARNQRPGDQPEPGALLRPGPASDTPEGA